MTNSLTPVFVLDSSRMVLVFNRGCEELTGWSAGEVVGQVCDYTTETDCTQVESVTGCLCPPPEVLAGRPGSADVAILHRDGASSRQFVQFLPLLADDASNLRILGIITDGESTTRGEASSGAADLHLQLAEAQIHLRQQFEIDSLIAIGPHMQRVVEQIRIARSNTSTVHLVGERGTGKEHIARLIHFGSDRRLSSFVPVDCESLTAFELKRTVRRLLESDRAGESTEFAIDPGAVYFRQIGDMPRDIQQMVIQAFRHDVDPPIGLRLFADDTRSLESLVEAEVLLPELYCLITSLTIHVPSLRRRTDELPLIAQQILEILNRDQERQVTTLSAEVIDAFRKYNWPGNLDELRSLIEEARHNSTSATIQSRDLPYWFRAGTDAQTLSPAPAPQPRPLMPYLQEVEAAQIRWALEQAKNNKSMAAELLGLTRARLYRRMQALGIGDPEPA